ncbi:MAG: adenylate/guanylate cyclase domain-containing protein [Thermoplasmata archaeon]|nr:adenylate/guanylate cyclase domain-containing protein [Thermoplasmata archaeon]
MIPDTKYAKSGRVYIAYQSFGKGPPDVVLVPGWASHLEYAWENPLNVRFMEGLGSFARVVSFDKRGTGLSDRVAGLPILEERMDDVRAVMDEVGLERAALVGMSEGGSMSALFAATYPQRTTALILYGAFAKRVQSPDYPWAPTREERERWIESLEGGWGVGSELTTLAPSVAHDPAMQRWFAAYGRMSVTPSAVVALARMNTEIDIRAVLPAIHVPTLVLHRKKDRDVAVENGRYLAKMIAGARLVELEGEDHVWWAGDGDSILGEVEEFLTGARTTGTADRQLMTVLFTDIVRSTESLHAVGDKRWRALLLRHNELVRKLLTRYRGREVKTTGDGFLATFDGPARGIQCACAIRDGVKELGLSLRLGLHTGECEVLGSDVGGVGVHLAQRVMAQAGPGEVLVSGTVRDLVSGSGLQFADRGTHTLKGVPGKWHLFGVV